MKVGVFAGGLLEERGKDRVLKETNEENLLEVLDFGQGGNVMRDDGLARDREQRLGDVERKRTETRATGRTADEDDSLGMHYCMI